ncbi:MAG: EpsG family protein [Clostridia bacterium]|nr:EpsG family protein [Clostridia bacterium]
MLILLGLSILPSIIKLFMGDVDGNKQKKKLFLILCGLLIVFVVGFRHVNVGTRDTETYWKMYENAMNSSSLKAFLTNHKVFETFFLFSECLFSFFLWALAKIIPNPQILIFITSAFVTISVLCFIFKHSKNTMLSVLMYICLGAMTFNMNGMRQAVAIAICLFAYGFAKDKKLIPFLLIVLIATLVHKSAIFFVVVYFVPYFKLNLKSCLFFALLVIAFILLSDRLAVLFDSFTGEDYGEGESFSSGGYITLLIYILTIIFAFITAKNNKDDKSFSMALFITILGCSLFFARYISTQIYERMSYYFFYGVILLLPQSIETLKDKDKKVMITIVSVLSILLFAYRLYGSVFQNFTFFWA